MYCAHCGSQNPDVATFCHSCGRKVLSPEAGVAVIDDTPSPLHASPRVCPKCGLLNVPTAVRCDCGHGFGSANETISIESTYLSVGTLKLLLLTICSFGLYAVVWHYKNWKAEQAMSGETLSPVLRAIFSPIFFFGLAKRMNDRCASIRPDATFSASGVAWAYLLLNMSWRLLPGPTWLMGFAVVVPMVIVQQNVDKVTPESLVADRHRYTAGNIATIVVGGLLLALVIWGALQPTESA